MLWTIAIILGLLWVLGLVTATTLSGYIHVLAIVALVLVLVAAFRAGTHSERRRSARRQPAADSTDTPDDDAQPSPGPA